MKKCFYIFCLLILLGYSISTIQAYSTNFNGSSYNEREIDITHIQYAHTERLNSPNPPITLSKEIQTNLPEVVFVQGGAFNMGDIFEEGMPNEKPIHKVKLSDYYIGKHEVTLAQFRIFVDATGYKTDAELEGFSWKWTGKWEKMKNTNWQHDETGKVRTEDSHPVIHVSWNDAMAYCSWASELSGKHYSLPTEAQWEYAARGGGAMVRFGNGKNMLDSKDANFNASDGEHEYSIMGVYRRQILPVGSFKCNDLGLHDMTGNVWEWCRDWFEDNYYGISPSEDPENTSTALYRVLRGGSWNRGADRCRVAYRASYAQGKCANGTGFRIVIIP